jgi:hypothetical protein
MVDTVDTPHSWPDVAIVYLRNKGLKRNNRRASGQRCDGFH